MALDPSGVEASPWQDDLDASVSDALEPGDVDLFGRWRAVTAWGMMRAMSDDKTARRDETIGDQKTGDQKTGEQKTGDQKTGDQKKEAARTAKAELFDAIDHFKNAAGLLFDQAAKSKPMQRASDAVDDAMEKIDPSVKSATKKADDFVQKKVDPAFSSATKEAERVITKLGQSAEPLARQLGSELTKLTKRISAAVGEAAKGVDDIAKDAAKKRAEDEEDVEKH